MNTAQLTGMRMMAEAAKTSTETRTAAEMAVVPHTLRAGAALAVEPNGKRWAWVERMNAWVRYG